MEKTIQELTVDKNIILVGNSVEILQHNYGEYIDGFDTVVRFGNGVPTSENYDAVGKRTDIFVTGFLRYDKRKFYPKDCLTLFNRSRIHLDRKPDHYPDFEVTEMFSDSELIEIYDLVGAKNGVVDGARPSAGFVAIQYFLRKCNFSSLTLIGFDFFQKSLSITAGQHNPYSWHIPLNTMEFSPHSNLEKGIVERMWRKGVIQWKILSDLEKGHLDLS